MSPTRTCVGCRRATTKDELIRFVRTPAGVRWDRRGVLPGRGAYAHRACLDEALGRLARALRTAVGREELGRLRRQLEGEEHG